MKFTNQVCVVTGGASGIGEAICRAFEFEGGRIAILDVDTVHGPALAESMQNAAFFSCNVSERSSVDEAFEKVIARWGRIDILVNNAGIVGQEEYGQVQSRRELQQADREANRALTPLRATVNLTDEQWKRMLSIHLDGTFFCTRAALRDMEQRRSGIIINISSINGIDGGVGNPHYSAAKAGILGFTRAVAREVILQGIRVNAVAPGFVDTPLRRSISAGVQKAQIAATPIGRAATKEEIASTVIFLASTDSSYFVGQTLSPNGGYITI